jgi:hypothetical protein
LKGFPMTKDPSMLGAPTHERIHADFYPTPAWCTEVLLRHWAPKGVVWEPAAGDGAISDVLHAHGISVIATDLHPRGNPSVVSGPAFDFFKVHPPEVPFSIVTNPPYALAEEFLRYALRLTPNVAMLFRHEFDAAASRADLWRLPNFVGKVVLTRRPRWIAGTTGSPRHNYSWYCYSADRNSVWSWAQ